MSRKSFAQPQDEIAKLRLEIPASLVNRAMKHWGLLLKLPAYHEMGYVFTASSAAKFFLKALFDELDRLEGVFGSSEALLTQAYVQKTLFPMLPLPMPPLGNVGDSQELELEQRRAAFLSAAQEFDPPTSALASAETAPAPEPVKNGKKKRSRSTSQAPQEPVFPDGILPGGEPGPPFRIRQRRKTSKKGEAR